MLALRLGPAQVRFTGRAEGDLSAAAAAAREARQRAIVDRQWKTGRQVHGARAVFVNAATEDIGDADGLVTVDQRVALAVRTADCAPVAFASDNGVVGVAHAGWRGLVAGILEETVRVMRTHGAGHLEAALGPCIRAECYEFGSVDLDSVARRYGDGVRATTRSGARALDVAAAVRQALGELDVDLVHEVDACTACDEATWWSHRARAEQERQATVVWIA